MSFSVRMHVVEHNTLIMWRADAAAGADADTGHGHGARGPGLDGGNDARDTCVARR